MEDMPEATVPITLPTVGYTALRKMVKAKVVRAKKSCKIRTITKPFGRAVMCDLDSSEGDIFMCDRSVTVVGLLVRKMESEKKTMHQKGEKSSGIDRRAKHSEAGD